MTRKMLLAGAVFGVVVGSIAVAVKLDLLTSPKVVASGPLQIVTFDDGAKLEILGISVGERVVEVAPRKRFSFPFSKSKGSSGGMWGGLRMSSESENGQVLRWSLHSDSPAAMLMEFRMMDGSGRKMKFPSYLTQRQLVDQDERLGGPRGTFHFFKPKDESVESLRDAMDKTGLQLLIQQRDPQSGWINLMGPSMYHEPWPDRYIVTLTAWQRSLAYLDFRAIRADGQVAEFSLANPDFRKSPTPGSTKTLPFVHIAGDFELSVKHVERFATLGDHPFAAVEMNVRYTGNPVMGFKDGPIYFDSAPNGAEDEWGNVVDFRRETIRKKASFGAFLPAASKRLALNLTIMRADSYPSSVHAGFVILEGVVGADGVRVNFTAGPDADLLGTRSMPIGTITSNSVGSGRDPTNGWKQLTLEISGSGDSKALKTIENRIGSLQNFRILVFPENRNESVGSFTFRSGGSGSGAGKFNFNRRLDWSAPPELLRPGAKIRVGIQAPLKNENVRFDLELPELIQPW